MITRKPRKSKTSASSTKRVSSRKKEEINISMPVISDENLHCEDVMKIRQNIENLEKIPRVVIPKIKIRCEPLNVEKVIDLVNNKVVSEGRITKPARKKGRKVETVKTRTKSTSKDILEDPLKEPTLPAKKKPAKRRRKKLKDDEIDENLDGVLEVKNNKSDDYRSKSKIKLVLRHPRVKQCNSEASTSQKREEESGDCNLNVKSAPPQVVSCFYPPNMDDVPADFVELNDMSLEELAPFVDAISQAELKMKPVKNENIKTKNTEDAALKETENTLLNSNVSDDSTGRINDINQRNENLENRGKTCLQVAVESFIRNPQLKYLTENTALKKGLCLSWLSNNYRCINQHCVYSHNISIRATVIFKHAATFFFMYTVYRNHPGKVQDGHKSLKCLWLWGARDFDEIQALNLFTRKLKQFTSKCIITVIVSMRNDTLFADVVLAAFKVLSERKIPVVWVTFLTFFVFYVTEPSDSRFLKFWANAARFFCQLSENYAGANGFASLLSIFVQGAKSEEWKIIEFIKVIKKPPVQIKINYALLQPVLKLAIPSEFLAEAVESCIATQKDLLKVYSLIIPKISIMTSPIHLIELLLKFCETLEQMNHKNYADDLRQRLREKVMSFKTKISRDYPLTASLQEDIFLASNEETGIATCIVKIPKQTPNLELENIAAESNFFQLEEDFYGLMSQAMELSPDSIPSPYRNALKHDSVGAITSNTEEDICERQVTRIKQFFRDCQFDLLGKYFNELRPNVVERAAEEFLKLLLNMKISLQQSIDLVKIIILPSKSENSAKAIASISVTLILNLVRINEWDKAFTILSLCQERRINLLEGKVFYFNEFNTITQCRIILLFIEIYAYKDDYASAVDLVKKYFLFSSNNCLWKLTWKAYDETARVRILEDLLQNILCKQLTVIAFNLFEMIWREQKQLLGPVDLRKFINEMLILLLNHNSEEAITLFDKIQSQVRLCDTTVRAVLVTLFRCNYLSAAKNLFLSSNQTAYSSPEVLFNSSVIRILSFWLEEEIYVLFDAFFDFLLTSRNGFDPISEYDFEIQIQASKPNVTPTSSFRPLCLGIINPSIKDACTRIQRVLQYQFNPAVKLIILPYCLKLDEYSVKLHLHKRMSQKFA